MQSAGGRRGLSSVCTEAFETRIRTKSPALVLLLTLKLETVELPTFSETSTLCAACLSGQWAGHPHVTWHRDTGT